MSSSKVVQQCDLISSKFLPSPSCGESNLCTAVHVIISLFGLFLAPFLSLSIDLHPQDKIGCQEIDRERLQERIRPEYTELHELPYT